MEIPLLKDIVIIFGLAITVLLICFRLRIPTIVGFLITGVLCGPHGLGLVSAISEVRILAEIGIVVLLFTVGLEISIKKILEYKRFFFIGGAHTGGTYDPCWGWDCAVCRETDCGVDISGFFVIFE